MINTFSGEYDFLSNFYPTQIRYGGVYPTAEHAFQAMKTLSLKERFEIAQLATPGQAKRAGKKVSLRPDWEEIKLRFMEEILYVKFYDRNLAEKLIATRGQILIEGNNWGDTFWGVCKGKGQNQLGKLLMAVRATYRRNYSDIAAKYPLPVVDGIGCPLVTGNNEDPDIPENKPKCLSCHDLISEADAAGGGTYKCKKNPGIVIGEWGHWTDGNDPTPICE